MAEIVECVPNFSEGQNKEVIDAIAQAIASVEGCSLLDVDPGVSTNRTVYTFVGSPESVVEGALNGARMAMQLIDMRKHHGMKTLFFELFNFTPSLTKNQSFITLIIYSFVCSFMLVCLKKVVHNSMLITLFFFSDKNNKGVFCSLMYLIYLPTFSEM